MVRNCLDNPQTVRTIWKLFEQSKNCPYNPETFWTTQKLSGQFKNCPDNLETVWIIRKLSGQPKNYADNSKTDRNIQKLSRQSETVCHKDYILAILPQFVICLGFTRICREIVDVAIYALYPESFCGGNLAIRKVFTFSDSAFHCLG